ncbi:hypothetical protein [Pelagibius sp.]|uniref:hypothetical protein n=1 Tax=Pelagibius sp. TaxID=1931238 RepID=UPI002614B3C3|nr:hypothetical protein [Pelagibius sp.]
MSSAVNSPALRRTAKVAGLTAMLALASQAAAVPIPEAYRDSVQQTQALARALYDKQRAASAAETLWGSDAREKSDLRERGQIVEVLGDGRLRVSIAQGGANDPVVSRQVAVKDGAILPGSDTRLPQGAAPSPRGALLWAARATALGALRRQARLAGMMRHFTDRCPGSFRTVTLAIGDGAAAEAIYVYFLWEPREPGFMVLGGHFRVELTPGGEDIVAIRESELQCQHLLSAGSGIDPDDIAFRLAITHADADHPNEIQVLSTIGTRNSLSVSTPESGILWRVARGRIRFIEYIS